MPPALVLILLPVIFIILAILLILRGPRSGKNTGSSGKPRKRIKTQLASCVKNYQSPLWYPGKQDTGSKGERLTALGLPIINTPDELARELGMTRGQLLWLSSNDRKRVHYRTCRIPKRDKRSFRMIHAPRPYLKRAQRWILKNILERVTPHPASAAFSPGDSIFKNASNHAGQEMVCHFDLRDFFPSVKARRVAGLFRSFGYSEQMSLLLTCLTTIEHRLPQGAPTSPAIANLVCKKMDARLSGLAARYGGVYTRYADDLVFSGGRPLIGALKAIVPFVRKIVREEGFQINRKKTRFARKGTRQRVTGLVVNTRVSVPRSERRQLRAILHNLSHGKPVTGPEARVPDLKSHLRGRIAFLGQAHPDEARRLMDTLQKVT